jgi:MFS family permease
MADIPSGPTMIDPAGGDHHVPASESARGADYRYSAVVAVICFSAWFLVMFDVSFAGILAPVIARSLHFNIAWTQYVAGIGGLLCFGVMLFGGLVIDRLGRKISLQLALVGTGVFSGLTALVGSLFWFAVVRVFASISVFTEGVTNTILAEQTPTRMRGIVQGMVQSAYPLAAALAGVVTVAMLPHTGWRPIFLLAFLPAILTIFVARYIRESAHRRSRPAPVPADESLAQSSPEGKARLSDLFVPGQRRQSIVISLYGAMANVAVSVISGLLTTYLVIFDGMTPERAAAYFTIASWAGFAGQVLTGILAEFISSKYILIAYPLISGTCILLLMIHDPATPLLVTLLLLATFCGEGIFGCYPRYVTESFPRRIRGTGTSFVLGCSVISSGVFPFIAGGLLQGGVPRIIPLIGGAAVAVSAVVLAFGRLIKPKTEIDSIEWPGSMAIVQEMPR